MSTDMSGSGSPLPGLPKAILYIQLLSSLMESIKRLIDHLRGDTVDTQISSDQS